MRSKLCLYALARHRERRLAATAETPAVLLGTVRRTEELRLIARRAREVSGAGLVMVLLYDDAVIAVAAPENGP